MSTEVTSAAIVSSTVDSSPIGGATPSTAKFITPSNGDASQNAATTQWVRNVLAQFIAGGAGYVKFPNGLIIQWVTGTPVPCNSGEGTTQTLGFPLAFPNACVFAGAFTQLAAVTSQGDVGWQVTGTPGMGSVVVQLQKYNEEDSTLTTPSVLVIGY